jgi:hypothetical protein
MHLTTGVGFLLALVCGQVEPRTVPPEEDPIAAARATLYTNRAQSLAILEDAVRKSPERADYWIE